MALALITGIAGETLSADEASFLRAARPAGLILFSRNCKTPDQVRGLIADAASTIGDDTLLVLIDQEGGRVRRLRPPYWRALPPAAAYAALYTKSPARARHAASIIARLTAADLRAIGITVNCAPVLDVPTPGAHDIIGDRAYGRTPGQVADLGRAVAEGYMAGGVLPVMKHIPGHGRALVDSHAELPVVDAPRALLEETDFAPFRALRDLPAAMTAHVVYREVDPAGPASTSPVVVREIIRGAIGFNGLLMSDDLGMNALSGDMRSRAEGVIRAGSDLALHCSGVLAEMQECAASVPVLSSGSLHRVAACHAVLEELRPFDVREAEAVLTELLGAAA
jgi:beta-N-acetylhexosaminidase